jgi:hypothetical protein
MKRQNDNYDQLWKMKTIYDKLNGSYRYDSPIEHLEVDISTVLFIFKHYIQRKHRRFGIKTYKLHNSKVYRNNMNVYLGKDKQYASPCMTATHATVTGLNVKLDNVGQKQVCTIYFHLQHSRYTYYDNKVLWKCQTKQKRVLKNFGQKI